MNALLTESIKTNLYDLDPGDTDEHAVAWVDMRDFGTALFGFFRTIGTSNLTLKVQGSAASDGGSPVDVKTKTITAQPDAVGDQIFLEVTQNDITEAGEDIRYISMVYSLATGTDEGVALYVQGSPRLIESDLTADVVA
jgi:hypothetical protein